VGDPSVIAFYLPQFAPAPENDLWWGRGFTEWTMVTRARPLFPGHRQPRRPSELGYYDLRVAETRQAQADLAAGHGIAAFCYYHYWSRGHRLLGRLLDDVLRSGVPDFPFCLSWTNHPWNRKWDAGNDELLFAQEYSPRDDLDHIRWLCDVFADLLVHWAHHLPDARRTVDTWRSEAARLGAGDPYLLRVEATPVEYGTDPRPLGFDASVQWQPGDLAALPILRDPADVGHPGEVEVGWALGRHRVYRYADLVAHATAARPPYPSHPCLVPGWDNTPRRSDKDALVFHGAEPRLYRRWLETAVAQARADDPALVFVNAWNEWSESAYLEPDTDFGRGFLQAHLGLGLGLPAPS
jgi:hypothetical protein